MGTNTGFSPCWSNTQARQDNVGCSYAGLQALAGTRSCAPVVCVECAHVRRKAMFALDGMSRCVFALWRVATSRGRGVEACEADPAGSREAMALALRLFARREEATRRVVASLLATQLEVLMKGIFAAWREATRVASFHLSALLCPEPFCVVLFPSVFGRAGFGVDTVVVCLKSFCELSG